MPNESAAPLRLFPRREVLAGFFRTDPRGRVRVPALAQLLGAPDSRVRDVLLGDGVELRFDSLAWGEAAGYLFDAWPRARIIAALGPDATRLIPAAFHPTRVRWRIPIFILRAMRHQAALMREHDPRVNAGATAPHFLSPAVEDYIADILFTEIQPSTVAHLETDRAFFAAYHYPPL
jgi:hypothetical protein